MSMSLSVRIPRSGRDHVRVHQSTPGRWLNFYYYYKYSHIYSYLFNFLPRWRYPQRSGHSRAVWITGLFPYTSKVHSVWGEERLSKSQGMICRPRGLFHFSLFRDLANSRSRMSRPARCGRSALVTAVNLNPKPRPDSTCCTTASALRCPSGTKKSRLAAAPTGLIFRESRNTPPILMSITRATSSRPSQRQ